MKEFVEKLIERLEEEKRIVYEYESSSQYEATQNVVVDYEDVIEIVKDLASEHNNGWISVEDALPEDESKSYIVQKTNGIIEILSFTKDAYKLSKYDFSEYKGKKKTIFYDWDSEYGYCEWECIAWQPLPAKYEPKELSDTWKQNTMSRFERVE